MKIKKIRIKSKQEFERNLLSVGRALDQGRTHKKPFIGEYFESLDAVRNILTDKRLDLWRIIRDKKPNSISTLAKLAGRGFKAVHRDLRLLENLGLITFKKAKGKRGDLQTPVSLVDELRLAVA